MRAPIPSLVLLSLWLACGIGDASAGSKTSPATPATSATSAARPTRARGATSVARSEGNAAAPAAKLDPAPFERVLKAHVREGAVDYRALVADAAARKDLAAFLEAAAKMDEAAPLSSWLNVYNALVIQLVVERYPIESVMKVPGFFKTLKRTVAGKPRTLDAIEHAVIRPRFRDARVHMALNCGAVSCPPLSSQVFRETGLDARLDALARAVVADPSHVELKGDRLELSALFFWFADDFARDAGSVLAWVKRHAPEGPIRRLPVDTTLVERSYDWTLAQAQ